MTRILKYKIVFNSSEGFLIKDVEDLYLSDMGVRAVSFKDKDDEYVEIPLVDGKSNLMEFTGIFDNKGFGIYTSMVIDNLDTLKRYIVNFADGAFYAFNVNDFEDYILLDNSFGLRCEIIGNEYINPELCTPSKEDFNKVFNITE